MCWVKIFGGLIFGELGRYRIIYLLGSSVNILEVKFSKACSISENLTLPKICCYTVVSVSQLAVNECAAH